MRSGRAIGFVLMALALGGALFILYQPVQTKAGAASGVACANNAAQPTYSPPYTQECADAVRERRVLAGGVLGAGALVGFIIVMAGRRVSATSRRDSGGWPY